MLLPFVFLSFLALAHAKNFYVSSTSASRNDNNAGTSVSLPWASINAVNNYNYKSGFRAGDVVYFDGSFNGPTLDIRVTMTYGTLTSPVRFTSLNPSQPATFYSIQSTGILISAGGGTTSNDMNIKIDNIIIIGDGGISPSNGNPQSGVFLWLDSNANIPWKNFYLDHVDISGFSLAGLNSWRSYHYSNNFLDTIVVSNSAFHHCPGYPNLQKVSGSGIVLAGVRNVLIETTTVYSNGAQVNYAPGGFGMWVFDADSVVMKNNTAHDNLSQAGDGGGFDLDCGTTNSIIEDCISYNNYGTGYGINACGAGNGYNNDGSTANNMVRRSTSYGDSYGKSDCLACIYAASGTIVNNVTYEDMTMEMTRTLSTVAQFGSGFSASYGAWLNGDIQAIEFQNVLFKFPSTTFFTNAECSNTGTAGPVCNGITTSPSASPLPSPPTAAPMVALKVSSLAPSARPTTASVPVTLPTSAIPISLPVIAPITAPTKVHGKPHH